MKRKKAVKYIDKKLLESFPEQTFLSAREVMVKDAFENSFFELVDFIDKKNKIIVLIDQTDDQAKRNLIASGHFVVNLFSKNIKNEWLEKKELLGKKPKIHIAGAFGAQESDMFNIEIHGGYVNASHDVVVEEKSIKAVHESTYQNRTEINDLIGRPPGWLLHSGITIVALVIAVLLLFSALIKYPDKIVCKGVLTSASPPIALTPKINGKIDEVLVKSGAFVNEGDKLIYLQNTANLVDVEEFSNFISMYGQLQSMEEILDLEVPDKLSLGEMQNIYGQIVLKYKEYQQVLLQQSNDKQINTFGREILNTKKLNTTLSNEQEMYNQELALIEKDYERSKSLFNEGVISEVELEQAQAKLTQYQRQKESMQKGSLSNVIRIEGLRLERDKLKEKRQNVLDQYRFSLNELVADWETGKGNWEASYFIEAQETGKVEWHTEVVRGLDVLPSREVGFLIIDEDKSDEKFVIASAPVTGVGKLKKGSKVIIKLDAFPYKEFGLIISKVKDISTTASISRTDDAPYYEIQIPIESTIITDHKKTIPFTPKMGCTAEIITDDKSILGRIMEQFVDLIKNS